MHIRERGNLPRKEGNSTAVNTSSDFCYNSRHTREPETLRYTLHNMCMHTIIYVCMYYIECRNLKIKLQHCSVLGKRPLPGKHPCTCTSFQGVNVAASIQTHGNYVPGKRPCGPKSRCMFKRPGHYGMLMNLRQFR